MKKHMVTLQAQNMCAAVVIHTGSITRVYPEYAQGIPRILPREYQ